VFFAEKNADKKQTVKQTVTNKQENKCVYVDAKKCKVGIVGNSCSTML